ncbi:hypothetical protein F4802DRAFT_547642 [Xylaria palmicola]|nr:hypothetical protein F4802DRAFT_547642 [Xylaria palmicola]
MFLSSRFTPRQNAARRAHHCTTSRRKSNMNLLLVPGAAGIAHWCGAIGSHPLLPSHILPTYGVLCTCTWYVYYVPLL